jgi:hypothetical protein
MLRHGRGRLRRVRTQAGGQAAAINLTFRGATSVPGTVSVTRASAGTRFTASGLLETVSSNIGRLDHVVGTGAARGLLIEEGRTNILLHSRDLSNAAWVKTSATATLTATGLDGVSNSASVVTATAANGIVRQSIVSASSARITSLYIKRRTGTGSVFLSQGQTNSGELMPNGDFSDPDLSAWTRRGGSIDGTYDASTGQFVYTIGAGDNSPIINISFTTVVGTLYRVNIGTTGGTAGDRRYRVTSDAAGFHSLGQRVNTAGDFYFVATGTTSYFTLFINGGSVGQTLIVDNVSITNVVETTLTVTSDWTRVNTSNATFADPTILLRLATSGDAVDIDGAQHETGAGALPTSFIPTTTVAVARAADVVAYTDMGRWPANEGTVVVRGRGFSGTGGSSTFWQATDGANALSYDRNVTSSRQWFQRDATPTIQWNLSEAGYVEGAVETRAVAFKLNDVAALRTGGVRQDDTSATVTQMTVLNLGSTGSASFLNGHMEYFRVYSSRRSNESLATLVLS